MKGKNKINEKSGKSKKNRIKKNHLFLIAMIVLLIGAAGVGAIIFTSSNSTVSTNEISSSNSNNNTNETVLKERYGLITIYGLKCYVKTEYMNFIHVTENTSYDGMDGYYELTEGKSVDFVDYTDFAQFYTRDGKFRIEITKYSEPINISYLEDNDDVDTVRNITVSGNNVTVVHFKEYSDQTLDREEYTFVYFKLKNKSVELGWAGNTIDMYVIESFFKLN